MKKRSRIQTHIADRKARRKDERQAKKRKRLPSTSQQQQQQHLTSTQPSLQEQHHEERKEKPKVEKSSEQKELKRSKKEKKKSKEKDIYDIVDEETAAALRRDDEEIALLEQNLGLNKSSKDKKKLHKEYAKLEGYGDDFGDFLDGLDGMLEKIAGDEYEEHEGEEFLDDMYNDSESDESDNEVSRARKLLRKELQVDMSASDDESDSGEEMVPMKDGDDDDDDNDDDDDDDENSSDEEGDDEIQNEEESKEASSEDESSDEDDSDDESEEDIRDHDEKDTYRPVTGQDLYGNTIDTKNKDGQEPKKYIPPHLRKKQSQEENKPGQSIILEDDNDPERKEKLRLLQRLLNNNLNRLADNTLESVAKSISTIYTSNEYSVRDTNECFWKNIKTACVVEHMVRSGLIPIYIACVSGVHFQAGDAVQLGSDVVERTVLALWDELNKYRNSKSSTEPYMNKEASNYMLILCYLYNYGIVHCTIMYDLVRQFIKEFTELDVELLLLILSHCGHQLRSDDPTALKDIVVMVQKRSLEVMNGKNKSSGVETSSRAQFMVTAITDLKNNKRKDKDIALSDKTSSYRKIIGRMKSVVSTLGDGKSFVSKTLRVTVQDILDIETKGRWWKVGAKWAGHKHDAKETNQSEKETSISKNSDIKIDAKQKKLLALAAKQRMNTDLRRSIFCIIMGSDDCQDAFENLVRNDMLKGKNEREVVRIIVHCCGTEKVYNPYYAFLGNRISEYQSNCRFTFQLTFWDNFKQFDTMKPRKAANLAKLLAYLLMNNRLNLNVLKVIDISPDDMPEAAVIFLTILFTTIFESLDDPEQVIILFKRGEPSKEYLEEKAREELDDDNLLDGNDRDALKENISIFLLHFLQSSPKNKKKSLFRKNLKAAVKACENDGFDSMI